MLRRRPGDLDVLRELQVALLLVEAKSVDAEVERDRGAVRTVLLDHELGEGQGRGVDRLFVAATIVGIREEAAPGGAHELPAGGERGQLAAVGAQESPCTLRRSSGAERYARTGPRAGRGSTRGIRVAHPAPGKLVPVDQF